MESDTNRTVMTEIEQRNAAIEEKKIEIELDKIKVEKLRAWSGNVSTFGSLFLVCVTVLVGIWSQYKQASLQYDLQDRQAKAQFELKAAEIVMGTDNPDTTLNKARALQNLFPQYLSESFAESFVPTTFAKADELPVTNDSGEKTPVVNTKAPISINKTRKPMLTKAVDPDQVMFTLKSRPVYRKRRNTQTRSADIAPTPEPSIDPEPTPSPDQ